MILSRAGTHLRNNVVAYLALFVALSGTAYAALGKNSVDSKQLAPGSVRSSELKRQAVKLKHIGFALGAKSSGLPDTTVGQGAQPHLFSGPGVNARGGSLLAVSTLTLTNPADAGGPGAASHVEVKLESHGAILDDRILDVADGETTSISEIGSVGDVNGFQEVNERVGADRADIDVDGTLSAIALPPPTVTAGH